MGNLRNKLLLFILPLCLTPLIGISIFSYYQAKQRITEDRIVLYLEQIAVDIADTIQLTLLEKEEEMISMGLYSEFRNFLRERASSPPQLLLDQLLFVHEVYDLLAIFDVSGTLLLTNSINRNRVDELLPRDTLEKIKGQNLKQYTPDSSWLLDVRRGDFGYVGWHKSELIRGLYDYDKEDVARQYAIGFAAPVLDKRGVVLGGVLGLMNWQYVQEILDKVEEDLEERSLASGYAFLFGRDVNTVIGHKYRRNRSYDQDLNEERAVRDNYGQRLAEDLGMLDLQQEILGGATHLRYEYPAGTKKISGWLPLITNSFSGCAGSVSMTRTFLRRYRIYSRN